MVSHKDGKIIAAHCNCMAGLGESCSHVATLLWGASGNYHIVIERKRMM